MATKKTPTRKTPQKTTAAPPQKTTTAPPPQTLEKSTIDKLARKLEETAASLRKTAELDAGPPIPVGLPTDLLSAQLSEDLDEHDVLIVARVEVYNNTGLVSKVVNRSTIPNATSPEYAGTVPRLFAGALYDNLLKPAQSRFLDAIKALYPRPLADDPEYGASKRVMIEMPGEETTDTLAEDEFPDN